mmetsp:Transcript_31972/g.81378  ORF Transcript_31972/g.81378 Transcript_31972/m.81378 type:complete len:247 (+) Transcript_31972:7-747(+)
MVTGRKGGFEGCCFPLPSFGRRFRLGLCTTCLLSRDRYDVQRGSSSAGGGGPMPPRVLPNPRLCPPLRDPLPLAVRNTLRISAPRAVRCGPRDLPRREEGGACVGAADDGGRERRGERRQLVPAGRPRGEALRPRGRQGRRWQDKHECGHRNQACGRRAPDPRNLHRPRAFPRRRSHNRPLEREGHPHLRAGGLALWARGGPSGLGSGVQARCRGPERRGRRGDDRRQAGAGVPHRHFRQPAPGGR